MPWSAFAKSRPWGVRHEIYGSTFSVLNWCIPERCVFQPITVPWTTIGRMSSTFARLRFATHSHLWCSRPDVGRLTSGSQGLISATLWVPARCPVIVCILQYALTTGWVQSGASCLFRSALVSVVSFHVVVGPSLLDGTAPVGGPDARRVLQCGQPDNSLVRVLSYVCTAKIHVEGADGPSDAKQRSSDGCSSVRPRTWRPSRSRRTTQSLGGIYTWRLSGEELYTPVQGRRGLISLHHWTAWQPRGCHT